MQPDNGRSPAWRYALLFAVVVALLSQVRSAVSADLSESSTFWGLSGLSVAILSASRPEWRWKLAAGLFAGSVTANLLGGQPPINVVGLSLAATLGALTAGSLLWRRLPQGRRIVRHQDIAWLASAGVIGSTTTVASGVVVFLLSGQAVSPQSVGYGLLGNFVGIIIGTPAVLSVISLRKEPPPGSWRTSLVLSATATAATFLLADRASLSTGRNFTYLVMVPLMIAAVWLGQRGTSILVASMTLGIAFLTARGLGAFAATESGFDSLIAGYMFVSVLQLTVLTISVETSRRRDMSAEMEGVLTAVGEGVLVVDETGTIRRANTGAERLFGADLVGSRLENFLPSNNEGTQRATRRDGSEFWAEVSRGAIEEHSGRRRTAVIVRDVTHRVDTEERIRRIQDEFVSNMTHELKTPLTGILGFTELALAKPDTPVRFELEAIEESASSMKDLIDNILDFKRTADSQRASIAVEIGDLVAKAVATMTSTATLHRVSLHTDLHPVPPVVGDPERLQQVVDNLISNAVKYSNDGGEVVIEVRPGEGSVLLTVTDRGIGISEEDQERLFSRFFRGANAHHVSGTGLGLALARRLVEDHGGSISLTSRLDQGTRVEVSLPTHPDATDPRPMVAGSSPRSVSP